jgi:hypothetical protein
VGIVLTSDVANASFYSMMDITFIIGRNYDTSCKTKASRRFREILVVINCGQGITTLSRMISFLLLTRLHVQATAQSVSTANDEPRLFVRFRSLAEPMSHRSEILFTREIGDVL